MTIILLVLITLAGAFGYLAWKHKSVKAAWAAFATFGASVWAAVEAFADKF